MAAGRILACRYVRLACERHLRDLSEGRGRGLSWDVASALHAIDFFKFLRHSKGKLARRSIALEPWQKFAVGAVFGWKREDGTRRFRVSYKEIPKKAGKSTEAAGVGLYGFMADGEAGSEVYAAATKREQARIVFGEAQRMVRASPVLRKRVGIFKLNLSIDATASKFEPLSSDDKMADGLNPHFSIVDELHRHRRAGLLDILKAGTIARRQPLTWIITTAGDDDPESVYAREHDYAVGVLEGAIADDAYFAFIATIDEGDRWDDPAVWPKANLNLGVTIQADDLADMARKAKNSPLERAHFKRFHLNVRGSDTARAIDMDVWARNGLGPIDRESLRGRDCHVALDIASKIDIAAKVNLFPPAASGERWKVLARFWVPGDNVEDREQRDRAHYRHWIETGWIETTPGNIIDHGQIEAAVIEDRQFFNVIDVAYDPWNATHLATRLQDAGLTMVEFIQGLRSYTEPTKELLAMLLSEKIDHGNNPVLTWMAMNLKIQTDKNENQMPAKKASGKRIDGMSALIMAVGRAIAAPSGGRSFWEVEPAQPPGG